MLQRWRLLLLLIVLLGVAMRWQGFFLRVLHPDEALFATWARQIGTWRDPLLQTVWVDKPPLLFYLQAIFYPLIGPAEWAVRIPNYVASVLMIPLTAQLTWHWYRSELAALIAATVIALSPFAIMFSPTGFTDPLLICLLIASLICASRDKAWWSGLLWGLALLTKYPAIFYLPLIGVIAIARRWRWQRWMTWGVAAGLVALVLFGWLQIAFGDLAFGDTGDGKIIAGIDPIYSWQLQARWEKWGDLLWHVVGYRFTWLIGVCWLALLWKSRTYDVMLVVFMVGFLAFHWLWDVPAWDRYVFPLVPLVAVAVGRGMTKMLNEAAHWVTYLHHPRVKVAVSLLALVGMLWWMAPKATQARDGGFRIGRMHLADHGADQIAQELKDAPYGTVLYDHWYSWQWNYHLFDTGVYIAWTPHPDELIDDLTTHYDDQRFIALPNTPQAVPFEQALIAANYSLIPIIQSEAQPTHITLYKIER